MTTTIKHKVLAFCEEITSCDCCGKSDLKGTYAIENAITGEINYYGSVCAFKSYNLTAKELKAGVKAAEAEAIEKAKQEYRETEAYKVYTQHMIDREIALEEASRAGNEEEHFRITRQSIELGNVARKAKEQVCKKYGIKYTYKIG